MAVALASLVFKAIPAGSWPQPIASLQTTLLPTTPTTATQKIVATKSMLTILTILAQELVSHSFAVQSHRNSVHESVGRDRGVVLGLIGEVLQANPDSEQVVSVKLEALKCVLAWGAVERGIPAEFMPTLLSLVTTHIQYRPTFQLACQVMAELLTYKDLLAHEKSVCDSLLPVLTSGMVYAEYQKCLEEEDTDVAHSLCTLLAQLGESFPKYMIKNLGTSQNVLRLVEMMLRFTGFPGYYGIDEDFSHIPDEFWYEMQESLTDDTVIPLQPQSTTSRPDMTTDPVTHEPVIHGTGVFDGTRIATRFLNRSNATGWDMSGFPEGSIERIWSIAKEVYSALVGVIRAKIERPKESELSEWNTDMRDKFRMFRMDKSETLLTCNRVLGSQMYDILVPLAVHQISEITAGRGEDGQALEATLYVLKSIAEEVQVTNTPHLHVVFGDAIMGQISKFPSNFWRVRLTFCLLIGEARHPNWLSKNPTYLLPVITFLMNSLNISPHITTGAIHSLEQVCSTCRKQLGPIAKDMLDAWENLKSGLTSADRIRLIRSVSSILEPLPPQQQLPHVMTLTGSMIAEIRTTLAVLAATPALLTQPPEVEVAERMLVRDLLRLIKGVCQGIQKSDDYAVLEDDDVDAAPPAGQTMFDMEQIDSTMLSSLSQLSHVIWETIGAVFQVFVQDEETIDIVCGLICMTLDTTIPIMFTPNPTKLATVLLQSFTVNQYPIILRVMTVLVLSIKEGSFSETSNNAILSLGDKTAVRNWVCQRVLEVNEVTYRTLMTQGGMTEQPDLIEYYFKFLVKVLNKHPWALIQLPAEHQNMLFGNLVLNGLSLQERSSCTAVFDFVRDLVSVKVSSSIGGGGLAGTKAKRSSKSMQSESQDSEEAKQCKELLNGAVKSIGEAVVRILFTNIGSGLPTSMWPLISDLLHRMIHYFPEESKGWVVTCLQVDGYPTQYCTREDKEEFIKGMMVAQMKPFKELVKKFGLKCRNLHDTSYGSAIRM
ncbi:armadillo-type protein [Obelidium mucronatum]|nr:armadillo-type protein [Obelidium mucronatum]